MIKVFDNYYGYIDSGGFFLVGELLIERGDQKGETVRDFYRLSSYEPVPREVLYAITHAKVKLRQMVGSSHVKKSSSQI